jgi:hypothetical protein
VDSLAGSGLRCLFYAEPDRETGAAVAAEAAAAERVARGISAPSTQHARSLSGEQMKAASRVRARGKTLVATFDERGVGYALEQPEARPCTLSGVRCANFHAAAGDLHRCAFCGRADVEHLIGVKLVLTTEGGDLTDERGNLTAKWLWDARRQGAGTPPAYPLTLRLTRCLTLTMGGRHDLRITFDCGGIHREFACGASLKLRESYDAHAPRSLTQRGKFEVTVNGRPSLAARTDTIVAASHDRKEALSRAMETRGLGGLVAGLDATCAAARERTRALQLGSATGFLDLTGRAGSALGGTSLSSSAGLLAGTVRLDGTISPRAAAALVTQREAPVLNLGDTGALATALAASQRMPSSSPTRAETAPAHMTSEDGYGGLLGASMHGGRWLTGPDTLRKLQSIHPHSSKSALLHAASGKYDAWKPIVRDQEDVFFRSLDNLSGDGLASYLTETCRPDQAVLVAMLHPAESHSRRVRQILEHANGTLAAAFPEDPQFGTALGFHAPPAPAPAPAPAAASAPAAAKKSAPTSAAEPVKAAAAVSGRRMCPFRIAGYNMAAASPAIVAKYNVKCLPTFLLFYGGKLVYAGPMGGAGVVGIPSSVRPVNVLIADPTSADQHIMERHLRLERFPYDLACGVFSAAAGKIVATCEAAVAAINRTAEHAASVRRNQAGMRAELLAKPGGAAGAGGAGAAWSGPAPGTDATAQVAPDYAVVLLDAGCGAGHEVARVAAAMASASHIRAEAAAGGAAATVMAGSTSVKLVGRSLLVACWPSGSVRGHTAMCATCVRLIHRNNRPAPAAGEDGVRSEPAGEWACPHCGVIFNANTARLLDGRASLAVCKPFKGGTLPALAYYWRQLDNGGGGGAAAGGAARLNPATVLREAGADPADPRVQAALAHVPLIGQTQELKGGLAVDDVHLGLTHNDVLGRLLAGWKQGKAGVFKADGYVPPLGVAVSETVVRGVPLVASYGQ